MVDLDDSLTPVLDEDTVKVSAFAAFDFDDPIVKIRWRGVRPPSRGGACCYTDPDTFETICDDTLTVSDCTDLDGEFFPDQSCDDSPCTGACCEDDGEGGFTCEDLSEDDCAAAGGDFKGIDTACSDDPDPCAHGACCEYDGMGGVICEDLTEGDCSDVGGTFKGAGTACSDDPDPCVDCPAITLTCDNISASKSKCGFQPFTADSDYRFFLTSTRVQVVVSLPSGDNPAYCNSTDTDSYDTDTCTHACTGGAVIHDNFGSFTFSSCGWNCIGSYAGCHYLPGNSRVFDTIVFSYTCPDSGTPVQETGTITISYTSEYTTAMLIANVEAALPAYDEVYTGGACAASRYLSTDETTYSIQRAKPRFEFDAATVDFTISYNEHFVPTGGGSPTDTPQFIFVSVGDTEAFGPEILEPSTNGTITVTDIECTLS